MLKVIKASALRPRIHQITASFFSTKSNPFDDFSAAENLFNNSEKTHKPVSNSEVLLKKFRIEKDMKKFAPRKHRKFDPKDVHRPMAKDVRPMPKAVIKEESYTVRDEETGLEMTILGLNDKLTNNVFTNIRSKKQRDKNGKIVIEGRRLILDAIYAGVEPEILFFSDKDQLKLIKDDIKSYKNLSIYKVPRHDLKIWSTLITTPGILAVFPRPNGNFQVKSKVVPLTVICDNIREPSNLGSILRSCAALPCSQVIVLKGSCDPWDSKCLRGGCGAQFRINIKDDIKWESLINKENEEFFPLDSKIFLAESKLNQGELLERVDYSECEYSKEHNVVVIGGETHGLSDDAYRLVVVCLTWFQIQIICIFSFLKSRPGGKLLHIPLAEGVDSLNSASALTVLLFEIRNSLK